MPSLKEIKTRIASVNSTRKITSAMKMVASSKLHHAQQMIENMLPYETELDHILKTFLESAENLTSDYELEHKQVSKVAVVVFTSNSSMCGGFNANIIRLLQQVIDEYTEQIGRENILIYPIGRKVYDKVKKLGFVPQGEYNKLCEKPNPQGCGALAGQLMTDFIDHKIDKVEMLYHHFRSTASLIVTREQYLPIDVSNDILNRKNRDLSRVDSSKAAMDYLNNKGAEAELLNEDFKPSMVPNVDFIVEPSVDDVLEKLIPQALHLKMYTAFLDSNACEHAARMIAMQTATDNADELLRELNLQYNKSRQQAITSELLDIVGGSQN